ncbi:hypothetical protein [Paracoccus sediminilitoris]|uniref:hypothetical protein n=1 Tax=Paracoccus sediminilitoris TaxID=2202419 RepID=UPI0011B941E8|nr:hypothetical protein [Paracoccus sediminilitoris]
MWLSHIFGDGRDRVDDIFPWQLRRILGQDRPRCPAADQSYDAGAIVALVIAQACKASSPANRDIIPQVTGTEAEPIHAGAKVFKKVLALIGAHQKICCEGVVAPVVFDQNGDITGAFRLWNITWG